MSSLDPELSLSSLGSAHKSIARRLGLRPSRSAASDSSETQGRIQDRSGDDALEALLLLLPEVMPEGRRPGRAVRYGSTPPG